MTMENPARSGRRTLLGLLFLGGALASDQHVVAQEAKYQGEIRGKITVTGFDADPVKPPVIDRYSTHRPALTGSEHTPLSQPAFRISEKAVIYLESEALKAQIFIPPSAHPILDQKDLAFHPQVLP